VTRFDSPNDIVLVFMSRVRNSRGSPSVGLTLGETPCNLIRKRILDSGFVYVAAVATDIKKTFARIRREQRNKAKAAEASLRTSKVFVLAEKQAMR
jgi:hypothetical protein